MLDPPFDNIAALKAAYFIKETPTKVFSCEYCEIFMPISKNSWKRLVLDILFPETREVRNGKWKTS